MPEFIIAQNEEDYREARVLLREYEAKSEVGLCFQGFEEEVETLEEIYGPPGGRFILIREEEAIAGCVGVRDLEMESAR